MTTLEEKLDSMKIESKDLKFHSKNFSMISIPPSDLSNIEYNDPGYISHVLSKLTVHPVNSDKFLESIAEYSNIKEYPTCNNLETQIIGFNSTHVYEMSFMVFNSKTNLNDIPNNDIASILNIEGEEIKGQCLIYKSYISNEDYNMRLDNIEINDIGELLLVRKQPQMVIYEDGDWREEKIPDIENYKKKFFGDDYIKEVEINYMSYTLKILYITSSYGEEALPEIIEGKIEGIIIYSIYGSMIDNFTIAELNKIRHLKSKKIESIDEDLLKTKKDDLGRDIVNTKYRLLNFMYRKNL
tara:strand:- start:404 stop:1297 length:894 start_codon:yes stop_codon:yes gene_type:complete